MDPTFFLRSGPTVSGPFTRSQLQRLAARKMIAATDAVSPDRRTWTPAVAHPELASAFVVPAESAVPTAPPPVAPPRDEPVPPPRVPAPPVASAEPSGTEIRVRGLGREVIDPANGKPRMLIRDVDLVLKPGELIALVGASGAGKSTLFGALSGRVRATHGVVLYDGRGLYDNFDAFRADIGYVPQKDLFHDCLPIVEALRTVNRLRAPRGVTDDEIDANIDRVLKIVSLTERRRTVIASLSGGEQKRVSIAMELLSRPRVLFLDEPTAPLDPRTTMQMMELFRELAASGITVILITHAASSLDGVDLVVYMHKGLLTFQGSPDQMKDFFGVSDLGQAYSAERDRQPDDWKRKFLGWRPGQMLVAQRESRRPPNGRPAAADASRAGMGLVGLLAQTAILAKRYVRVITIDRRNLVVLLVLAPLVAGMLCLATSTIDTTDALNLRNYYHKQKMLCFGSVMIVIFLALFASVREVIKELEIYKHEHFVSVEALPYLLSKVLVLLAVGEVQTAMVVAVVNLYGGIEAGSLLLQFGVLSLCSAAGTMLGLMISSLVKHSDHAVTGMILIVIPEILFSGALIEVKDVLKYFAGPLITAFWGLNAMMSQVKKTNLTPAMFGDPQWIKAGPSAGMIAGQFAVMAVLTYWLIVRKDGYGAAERIVDQMKSTVARPRASRDADA